MDTVDPAIQQMRGMIADARADFRRQAEPLAVTDADREALEDFEAAVGEVSAEQALNGYRRWLGNHSKV